mmetsp:Transcript_35665/g.57717  ORF Transcript_35665/g.57717 Transcript_35665/m.57717 type:complete len:473 (+) Transcript_35665:233-1651(+)|eukprot:CAMPEP_0184657992 /NCGR_PEP_ID=MMETSP0308-20130426/23236_1 /TAXON_ID=38269 /ORGANISM="Gloeochaete witrockiana, Strain SAG 46.84" /LENGTH=472 /DNA_ID=CAMNT_0027096555 /DNA_START=228 /DNA_END=1646 /DNA_ORIENTATION=+
MKSLLVLIVCSLFALVAAQSSDDDLIVPTSGGSIPHCSQNVGRLIPTEKKNAACEATVDTFISSGIPQSKYLMYTQSWAIVPAGYTLLFAAKIWSAYSNEETQIYFQDNGPVAFPFGGYPAPGSYTFMGSVLQDDVAHAVNVPTCYGSDTLVGILMVTTYIGNAALPFSGASVEIDGVAVDCGGAPVVVYGDPHVRTFDGLGVTYVTCGDHVMAKASKVGSFMYQSRFCLRGNDASSTCAVSLQCDSGMDVAELYTIGTKTMLMIGGKEVKIPPMGSFTASGLSVERDDDRYDFKCVSGVELSSVIRSDNSQNYLDSSLRLPPTFIGATSGLLGSWDGRPENDIMYRDGRIWAEGHSMDYVSAVDHPSVSDVQASWSVLPSENLFSLSMRQSGAECRNRNMRRLLSLRDDDVIKRDAMIACQGLGMTGVYMHTCVFDYIATGGSMKFIRNSAKFLSDVKYKSVPLEGFDRKI